MKRQIRSSVFETNSSSMHSLVILKDSSMNDARMISDDMYIRNDGSWSIWGNDLEFGRTPFCCLSTFESKVRYAIASLCSCRKDAEDIFKDIEKTVLEIVPECKNIKLPDKWGYDEDGPYYGYVDEDILSGFLKENDISLKEFFTNGKYIVIVDGDEYCIFEDMKKCGIIDANNIEKEYC